MDKKTCEFPYCDSQLANYQVNAGNKFCVIHTAEPYQKLLKDIKKLKEDNKRLSQQLKPTQTISYKNAVKILFNPLNSHQPYKVQADQDGTDYIVESLKSKTGLQTSTELIPDKDLFIRFAELPYTYEAYLNFVNEYGLFGLRYFKPASDLPPDTFWSNCPVNAEPFFMINLFQESIKSAFGKARNYKKLSAPEQGRLNSYLAYLLDETGVYIAKAEPTGLTLSHTTLAGAIVLQLYRFFVSGKELKKCQLPGCELVTANPKYCSEKHRRKFNAWKKRDNIELINGVWEMTSAKKIRGSKRGRPKRKG